MPSFVPARNRSAFGLSTTLFTASLLCMFLASYDPSVVTRSLVFAFLRLLDPHIFCILTRFAQIAFR